MFSVFTNSWALLFGMMLLMIGNGLHGTLLGVRGEIEQFSTFQMSIVMSAYFVGFLGASRMAPDMIRRVGHVRVFAALASFISAVLVLFPPEAPNMLLLQCRPLPSSCQESLSLQLVLDCGAMPSVCKSNDGFLGVRRKC